MIDFFEDHKTPTTKEECSDWVHLLHKLVSKTDLEAGEVFDLIGEYAVLSGWAIKVDKAFIYEGGNEAFEVTVFLSRNEGLAIDWKPGSLEALYAVANPYKASKTKLVNQWVRFLCSFVEEEEGFHKIYFYALEDSVEFLKSVPVHDLKDLSFR